MRILKDFLIALTMMSLWIVLAWWYLNTYTVYYGMPSIVWRGRPPACTQARVVHYEYSTETRWYEATVACPSPDGWVIVEKR